MDRDLTIMIYGGIMGVVGSILSSLVTTLFQFWLARRENERKQRTELRHVQLPTDEEVNRINAEREHGSMPDAPRKAAETGALILSVAVGGALVHQTNDPILAFSFAFLLGYLFTERVLQALRGEKRF